MPRKYSDEQIGFALRPALGPGATRTPRPPSGATTGGFNPRPALGPGATRVAAAALAAKTTFQWVCQISDNQRSAVGVLISAGWRGRRELPDQRTPAREEESSLDGERDVSFAAMSDSAILSQRIEGGTEA